MPCVVTRWSDCLRVATVPPDGLDAPDEPTLQTLSETIANLTARAEQLNMDLMLEVKAERHSGGSRRVRGNRPGGST